MQLAHLHTILIVWNVCVSVTLSSSHVSRFHALSHFFHDFTEASLPRCGLSRADVGSPLLTIAITVATGRTSVCRRFLDAKDSPVNEEDFASRPT